MYVCGSCKKIFRSLSGFDGHRTGEYRNDGRRCLTDAEMEAKGYRINTRGQWVIGNRPRFWESTEDDDDGNE